MCYYKLIHNFWIQTGNFNHRFVDTIVAKDSRAKIKSIFSHFHIFRTLKTFFFNKTLIIGNRFSNNNANFTPNGISNVFFSTCRDGVYTPTLAQAREKK